MTGVIFKRELRSYFATPLAYVFIIIFLVLSGIFAFEFGNFYARGQADLLSLFQFLPWLYLFLVPAITMRLWAEERKSGSLELLLTLPVTMLQAVLGKFLAAWVFCGIALALTFPMWITVSWLGDPDHGAIITGYLGSWLLAGGFLAVGSGVSAMTKNQVVAFIIAVVVCFILLFSGHALVLDFFKGWAPQMLTDGIAAISALTHFEALSKGVIDFRDITYFTALIGGWLYATALIVEMKKAD